MLKMCPLMHSCCERDGTSIILSDEVGQIFIIATGQGESQKDAKYDQVPIKLLAYASTGCSYISFYILLQL